ncbi:glycosyltransferase [Formosa sediminum]|uniref:Glycosyltransferase n=1 Tax=Formosa sediminum TaxID=2594004 RepID=A0A516GSQ0_9FLAO|nr:glycosyltransferase [Formosa sediminum]QDO94535.1 glycosyltransferase [Formosa sediminum]
MKVGLILIFHNNEDTINKQFFNSIFELSKQIHLSLINNGSTDNTLQKLRDIEQMYSSNLSLIDIKKYKGTTAAIKAGVRYLSKHGEFKYIGFLTIQSISNMKHVSKIIQLIKTRYDLIVMYNAKVAATKPFERKLFKNTFSMHDFSTYFKSYFDVTGV